MSGESGESAWTRGRQERLRSRVSKGRGESQDAGVSGNARGPSQDRTQAGRNGAPPPRTAGALLGNGQGVDSSGADGHGGEREAPGQIACSTSKPGSCGATAARRVDSNMRKADLNRLNSG